MSDAAAFRIVARKLIVVAAIVGVTVVITRGYMIKQMKEAADEMRSNTTYKTRYYR